MIDTTLIYFDEFLKRSKARQEICLGVCMLETQLLVKLVGPPQMTAIDVVRLYNDYIDCTLKFHGGSDLEALKPYHDKVEKRKDLQGILTEAISLLDDELESPPEEDPVQLAKLEPELLTTSQLRQILMASKSSSVFLVRVQVEEDCHASVFFGSHADMLRNMGLLTLGFRFWLQQMKSSVEEEEDDS